MFFKLTCYSQMLKPLIGTSFILFTLLALNESHADPMQDSQKRFSAYRERVFEFQNNNNTKYISGELNTLNQWITEAERYLREEEEEDFIRAVKLVQVQLRLVDISLEELDAREQILRLNEEANRLEAKSKNEREAVVELERRMGGSLTSQPKPAIQPPAPVRSAPSVPSAPPIQPTRFGGQP